jgi:Zn-dependent protease with chaperone function
VLDAIVVEYSDPVAYCVPDFRGGVVVVSSGARAALSPRQLRAVLAHEREHLAGHHHAVRTAVHGLSRLVPWLNLYRLLVPQVGGLLEMRADDVAARKHGRRTVAAAIGAVEAELVRAVGSKADREQLRRILRDLFTWHPMPDRVWGFVEQTQDELVSVGRHSGPSVADLLVAGTAQAWNLTVLHVDADFETIATVTELRTQRADLGRH